jgi:hypothetical protein
VGSPAAPAVRFRFRGLDQHGQARTVEVVAQERPVVGLVEVEEEAPVVLYEMDAARQPPPGTPVAERGVPLGPRAGMAG